MNKDSRSLKSIVILVAFVLSLAVATIGANPVQAAGVCPAPGTGLPGALNMIRDAKMWDVPMARDNPNGNIGMGIAVTHSACD